VARDPLFPFRLSQALCVGAIEKETWPDFTWLSAFRSEKVQRPTANKALLISN
jgi:hypothetical protein